MEILPVEVPAECLHNLPAKMAATPNSGAELELLGSPQTLALNPQILFFQTA